LKFSLDLILEFIAVVTGLIYPYLAGKNKSICWLYAIISAAIYVFINYKNQLYFFSALQFMYVLIAVYGWVEWHKNDQKKEFQFITIHNSWVIGVGLVVSLGLAYLAQIFTNQRMPFLDATNFVFALIASYMITQKIMESWIYLTVLNVISIYIYFQTKLYLSIILYVFLTFLAINAFNDWLKIYKLNKLQIK
jgi:nicotinamide mononucleotide transporter